MLKIDLKNQLREIQKSIYRSNQNKERKSKNNN